jgi:hypothetical protein
MIRDQIMSLDNSPPAGSRLCTRRHNVKGKRKLSPHSGWMVGNARFAPSPTPSAEGRTTTNSPSARPRRARSNEEPGPCLDRPRTIERVVLGQRVSAQSPSCQTRTLGMGQARLAATALSSRINLGAC